MKTVYKYPLNRGEDYMLPAGARVVHFALQDGVPCFWAEVDDYVKTVKRSFFITGTGSFVPPGSVHRGTCVEARFVWHLWERSAV